MSFWSKIRGTFETIFQIGKGGPQLKNSGGVVEHRNAADNAYAIARALDPVGNNDLVTLQYFNAHNEGAAGIELIKMPLAHITKVSTAVIPDNSIIEFCIIDVSVADNGTTPTYKITRTGDATVVLADTGDTDIATVGTYDVPQVQSWGSTGAGTITATHAGSGSTLGTAILYIGYSTPIDVS